MLDPEKDISTQIHSFPESQDNCGRMPLRIGLLMDHPSPHMTALLEALAARPDCTLEVLYCGKSAPERNWGSPAGNVAHHFLDGFTGPFGIRFNPGIFRALDRLRVDVWVVNTIYTSLTTLIAAWWLRSCGKAWAYMNEPVRPRSKVFSFLKEAPIRFVLDRADGVVGTGKAAAEMYRLRIRKNCPCLSVPYFIDLSDFSVLPGLPAPDNGQDLQFLTSCQMVQRKGLDCLLRACEKLPETGWRLTLVGDGPLRSKLESGFARHIRDGRVRFLGAVPYRNRARVFSNSHVFIFPSRWDGWGMVVPEALAAGLPVVSSDQVISAQEFIRGGENGFIVPAGNPDALAEKMRWFIQNAASCSRMSKAARKSVEDYKPDSGAATLVVFLRRLGAGTFGKAYDEPLPLQPEQTTWRLLMNPAGRFESAKLRIYRLGKDAVIRTSLVARRPKKPEGHLIVGYHLVLKEDKRNFEDHIRFFGDHFRLCSISDLTSAAASTNQDEFRLAITFDDGFRLVTEDCLEILEKHGIKAAFFVPSGFVHSGLARNGKAREFSRRAFCYNYPLEPMCPEDLRHLARLGHEIGSHGLYHTSLQAMSPESARKELASSRSMIAEWTGAAPVGFCYPYGRFSSPLGNAAEWLREAGFTYGLTLTRGSVDRSANLFALPRHHLEGNWPVRYLRYFLLA